MMRLRLTLFWFITGCVLGAPVRAEPPAQVVTDFSQLMAAFSRMPGLDARFVEEKHIGLLAQPLESRGRLYFARPGLFLRRVQSPTPSDVLITSKELRVRSADGEQRIDLASRAEVRPFVESLMWLLSGDGKALAGVYKIDFVPDAAKNTWTLTLTPKQEPIVHLIAHMRVLGTGLRVTEIQVRERSGDEAITRILDADPARHFTREELRELFGVHKP